MFEPICYDKNADFIVCMLWNKYAYFIVSICMLYATIQIIRHCRYAMIYKSTYCAVNETTLQMDTELNDKLHMSS